ncbi:MAG: fumarylacetoacetate hydrolase, partial [Rhodococcus sp. (in: high G+C Gram-positive bacteria)]
MRIANIDHRAALVVGEEGAERGIDLAHASRGRFGPNLQVLYEAWDDLTEWATAQDLPALADDGLPIDRALLGAPSPTPRQVFAVGLNYHAHAAESG